jgi:hypothetical protein
MKHNPFSLHNPCSGTKEIPCPFCNPYVYCHFHKKLLLIFILSQMKLVHTFCTLFFICILILFSYLHLGLLSGTLSRRFPAQFLCFFPHRPWMLQTSPHLVTLIVLRVGEEHTLCILVSEILPVLYKCWSFSLYNYFYPPLYFSHSSQHHVLKQWPRALTCDEGPTKHEIIRQVYTTSALITMKLPSMSLNRKPNEA